jgi:hypothetical protein
LKFTDHAEHCDWCECGSCVMEMDFDDEPEDDLTECECDNGHQQNDTVCRWCYARGRRRWDDPDIPEKSDESEL